MENKNGARICIDVKENKLTYSLDNSESLNAIQKCIVDFINNYNSKKYTIGIDFSFYIIYHRVRDLYSGNEYKFGQDYLKNENKEKLPIIHLTLFDIFDPPTFSSGDKEIKLPEVKRYSKIVDSSIWNYYFPLFATDSTKKCATIINYERFKDVLQKVANNTSKHLYGLSVADEYADLNARLLEQSYLKGSHKAISPFIFHSENELQTLIREEFEERIGLENESIVSQIKNYKWRILLVDDKADGDMSNNMNISSVNDSYGLPQNSKLSIIISLLDKLFVDSNHIISYGERVSNSENVLFSIEYAKKVSEAQDKIRNKKYDLILLDYLLEQNEYGYELLEEVYKEVELIKLLKSILGVLLKESFSPYVCEIISKLIVHSDRSIKLLCKEPYSTIVMSLLTESQIKALSDLYLSYIQPQIKGSSINWTQNEWVILCEKILSNKLLGDFIKKGEIIKAIEGLIDKLSNDRYKIGPRKRLFFMFISAYSYAVHDRLLAEGLNQSEDYWFINLGACPTNTPQLFLYNLLKLMDKRLEDSGMSKLSPEGIVKVVEKIYPGSGESPRKYASKYYQEVQSLQYHYRNILDDIDVSARNKSIFETSGSVLMTDFMNNHINLGGLLEHLAQLVHLTAFGTIRQWPEMWEEYIYFKAQLGAQLEKEEKDETIIERFNNLCDRIQDYISDLKSSSL